MNIKVIIFMGQNVGGYRACLNKTFFTYQILNIHGMSINAVGR